MAKTRGLQRRQYWQAVVRRQTRSGLSVAAFCRSQGVAEASFYAWKRRLAEAGVEANGPRRSTAPLAATPTATPKTSRKTARKTRLKPPSRAAGKTPAAPAGFVPVRITDEPRPAMIQVRWPGGLSVRIPAECDRADVEAVLKAVDALAQRREGG